jgi:hypothetical protein
MGGICGKERDRDFVHEFHNACDSKGNLCSRSRRPVKRNLWESPFMSSEDIAHLRAGTGSPRAKARANERSVRFQRCKDLAKKPPEKKKFKR